MLSWNLPDHVRIIEAANRTLTGNFEKRPMATGDVEPADRRPALATLLRTWRERALLTQEQLAGRTGLAVRTIRRLENDHQSRPRADSLHLLAGALGLSDSERGTLVAAAQDSPRRPGPAPRGAATSAPWGLPVDVAGFAGRTQPLREMDALLTRGAPPTTMVITAIGGTAGVGKTALAVHWAHRVAARFPDGQLYLNLRGFDPAVAPIEPAAAVRRLLDALAVAPQRIPVDTEAQTALYRSLMAGRRMLVVLDNAHDAAQVRPLLPNAPGCLTVVTSRNQLTGLVAAEGAHPLSLDLMSAGEARDLLASRLGVDRVTADPAATDEIIKHCAGLPLALAVAAARAAYRPDQTLAELAAELRDIRGRLDVLDTQDPTTDLRTVFSCSYQRLSPPTARLFGLLSLHPGPDISAPAVASLAGIPPQRTPPMLAELVHAYLINEHTPGRYTMHDLMRAYAAEQARAADNQAQRQAAIHRMLDHYLHAAYAADRLLNPTRGSITLASPAPASTVDQPTDRAEAMDWFTAELPVLLAAIDHAAGNEWDTHAWQLAWALGTFLYHRGNWHDLVTVSRVAMAAARRLADPNAKRRTQRNLAEAYLRMGRYNEADTHFREVLELDTREGDHNMQAHTHLKFAHIAERRGAHEQAMEHAHQALDLFRSADHSTGQASALNAIGWYHAMLGNHDRALVHCQQALALHQQNGYSYGQAATWDSLGYVYHQVGHYSQAVSSFQQAIDLYQGLGDRYAEADARTHLGDTHKTTGNYLAAHTVWQHALTILNEIDHPDADDVRRKLATLDNPRTNPSL